MGKEYRGYKMDQYSRVISRMDRNRDKDVLLNVEKKFMMDCGLMISLMEKVNKLSKMELYILVSYSMGSKMDLAFVNG